jgi:hypothetical protein
VKLAVEITCGMEMVDVYRGLCRMAVYRTAAASCSSCSYTSLETFLLGRVAKGFEMRGFGNWRTFNKLEQHSCASSSIKLVHNLAIMNFGC